MAPVGPNLQQVAGWVCVPPEAVVRDLAARLPVMIVPRWLRSRTEPVAIHDICIALVRSLELEGAESEWFDVPGPEVLSMREILARTAVALGVREPLMIQVPFL